ncbi:glycoside hydrolase family 3 N-terminal domain-containing protein [Streptomyces sp. P9(2023)]|uniref:glycoside hydrolase family 3 N-terminal domain-containing protein n=1 Tax=Streptomyces sp. P9(2023) TaxID=3064394 RepID=UPI0028F4590B|nr:glycoside hydrolase family 3 N-terminal domain-containing protein [Streptomyces sp. P9(2023)]MDT9692694.1 glycoside hydrolase family 3 N-terminal domain-containing protein [Streptomyces sp. P9(2023)]
MARTFCSTRTRTAAALVAAAVLTGCLTAASGPADPASDGSAPGGSAPGAVAPRGSASGASVPAASAPEALDPAGSAAAGPVPADSAPGGSAPVVVAVAPVTTVAEGATARVRVTLQSARALAGPVTVAYTVGGGTARPGSDYPAVTGRLTFPRGTAPGATRTIPVATTRDRTAEAAETIPLRLTVQGAQGPAEPPRVVVDAHGLPYLDATRSVRERAADLLGRMTLAEKAGQMTQAGSNSLGSPEDITTLALGSFVHEGEAVPVARTPEEWRRTSDAHQARARATRLQIPLLIATDAVHGHAFAQGTTVLPHNIGIGATRDPALAERLAALTAREVRATGVSWNFAPCLCVVRDERWGRTYESFGEDPELVAAMATVVRGLQGAPDGSDLDRDDKVLATAKHFIGDGGTAYGSGRAPYTIDQGVARIGRYELDNVHLPPFRAALELGAGSVMPSFSSLELDGDRKGAVKMHSHPEMLDGLLKRELGFPGIVVSDWEAVEQMPGDAVANVRDAINAGIDMNMAPLTYKDSVRTIADEVRAGRIPASRVDDAVRRILEQKFRLGLFERPYADTTHAAAIGSAEHRAVAREAVAKSQVLLKNTSGVLPLRAGQRVYVAGSNADDLGHQTGGWTVTWQGTSGRTIPGTTILEGIRAAAAGSRVTYSTDASAPFAGHDVGVVVVGETPYAEGMGDVGVNGHDLELSEADGKAVDAVCSAMRCVVLIVSGRPQLVGDRLAGMDALVASWLPGTEGAGVADVLYGKRPFTGRLPLTWPRSAAQVPINAGDAAYDPQFPYGWGLTTGDVGRPGDFPWLRKTLQEKIQSGGARAMTSAVAKPFAEAERRLVRGDRTGAIEELKSAQRAVRR